MRFFVALATGVFLTRIGLVPLARSVAVRRGGDKKSVHSIENITSVIGIFISLTVALQAASFGNLVTVLGAIAAAATVAVGFGMREQVGSVVAGIFIYTDNPFIKGDYIKVNDIEGVVKEIGLRATILNGGDSEKQVVPNSILTQNNLKNYTKGRRSKVSISTKIDIEKVEKVKDILFQKIDDAEETLSKPEPKIMFRSIDDGKTDIDVVFWIKDSKKVKEVRSKVLEQFNSEAIKQGLFEKTEA